MTSLYQEGTTVNNGRRNRLAIGAFLAVGVLAAYVLRLRAWMLDWGSEGDEATRSLPGDEYIENVANRSTNAITIRAPASAIWPWLIQMGCGRAGWYSYDLLDNGGKPSAEYLLSDFQELNVGDIVPSVPNGSVGFAVLEVEPERSLVFGSPVFADTGEPIYVPGGAKNVTWAFVLEPLDPQCTRLIVRSRSDYVFRTPLDPILRYLWEPAHFMMQRKQLLNVKRRSERSTA
jgi:proline iminopeptidase